MIKDFCLGFLEDQLKDGMHTAAEFVVQNLIDPSFIKEHVADDIQPSVNWELMLKFVKVIIDNNMKTLTPLFDALIKQPGAKREQNLAKITDAVLKFTLDGSAEFKKSITSSLIEKYHATLSPKIEALFKPIAGENANAIEQTADLLLSLALDEHYELKNEFSIKTVITQDFKAIAPMIELLMKSDEKDSVLNTEPAFRQHTEYGSGSIS